MITCCSSSSIWHFTRVKEYVRPRDFYYHKIFHFSWQSGPVRTSDILLSKISCFPSITISNTVLRSPRDHVTTLARKKTRFIENLLTFITLRLCSKIYCQKIYSLCYVQYRFSVPTVNFETQLLIDSEFEIYIILDYCMLKAAMLEISKVKCKNVWIF